MADLAERLRSGAIWSYFQSAGLALINFAAGIVLARLLEPSDFGVFIAVSALTAILITQVKLGLPEALIQADSVSQGQLIRCFWTMEGIALAAAVLFLSASTFLEGLYGDSRFTAVALVMTLYFFFVPYIAVASAVLKRELRFERLIRIRIAALLVSQAVTLLLALGGVGPMSLAIGGVGSAVVNVYLLARIGHWRVELGRGDAIRPLLRYAWRRNLAQVQETASERVDNLLVGALLGTASLGWYNRAFSLARLPVDQFVESFRDLIFSGLSRLRHDPVQTERMQYKLLCAVSAASFLALLLLLFIAGDFVRIVYGEKWLPSVPPLRAMILGAFTSTISLVLYSLCAAGNLVGRLARLGSVQLVLTIAVVLAAAPLGLLAVAAGIALRDLAMLLLLERVAARSHLSVSWRGILHALAPVLIATAVGALAGLVVLGLMGSMTPGAGILRPVGVVAGICAGYLSALLLCARLWPGHEPLAATLGFALHYARRVLPVRRQADAV